MPHAPAVSPDAELVLDADALLAADPAFAEVCDARRDGWIAAHASDRAAHADDFIVDEVEPRDGALVEHRACGGVGCLGCFLRGYRIHRSAND